MAAFKLTLTKTDTGDVLVDEEIYCLIGAIGFDDDTTGQMLFSSCSSLTLAATDATAREVIKKLETEEPIVAALTEAALKGVHEKESGQSD